MDKKIIVGIDGLGLIGGSIAHALKGNPMVQKIIGVNRSDRAVQAAVQEDVIEKGIPNKLESLAACDVIFICTPVDCIVEHAAFLSGITDALLTDVGSTKYEITQETREKGIRRFIGGHPMTGSERVGFNAANKLIMENAIYALTPEEDTNPGDLELLRTLVESMGSLPIFMDAHSHDNAVAMISHLPHLVATSLCNVVSNDNEPVLKILAAGGFKDITRIASSNPQLWSEIVLSSSHALSPVLKDFIEYLNGIYGMMERNDSEEITAFFNKGYAFRNSININGKGILKGLPEIRVDVNDRPGELGKITSLLGVNGINIQNINIQNSREYEGGSLRITLQDEYGVSKAFEVLEFAGYTVSV